MNKPNSTLKELEEVIAKRFNKKFLYFVGKPMRGSLELNHNNIREFINPIIHKAYQAGLRDAVSVLPEEIKLPVKKCINLETHLFGKCFECEKSKGFNDSYSNAVRILKK